MTLSRTSLTLAMLLLAAPAAAQVPQPEQPEPPPNVAEPPAGDTDETRTSATPISLSGCVQRGDGQEPDAFVLKRTASTDAPAPADAGDARPGDTPERPALSTYRLVSANPSVELGKHVGHQVQVTGRLQVSTGDLTSTAPGEETPTGRAGTVPAPTPETPEAPTGEEDAPLGTPILTTLEVDSLQMIASNCDDATGVER